MDDMANKYNNTYYNTIKRKPVDVKSNSYINSSKEVNDKDHKFKVGVLLQKVTFQIGLKNIW